MYYVGSMWWKTESQPQSSSPAEKSWGHQIELVECMRKYVDMDIASHLYVRKAYVEIYKEIYESCLRRRKMIITVEGTPGVGKTFFLLYMLFRFKEQKVAIGLSISSQCVILDQERKYPRMCDQSELDDYLSAHPECIYLHDPFVSISGRKSNPILRSSGITIITTSVDGRNTVTVKNITTRMQYYMPVWSCAELVACANQCYGGITRSKVVKTRFHYWGGSARNVLMEDDTGVYRKFNQILQQVDSVETLLSRLEGTMSDSEPDKRFQWLRHMFVSDDYRSFFYDWPSKYIRWSVLMQLKEIQQTFIHRIKLLANGNYIKSGQLYEDFVKSYFLKSGKSELVIRDSSSSLTISVSTNYTLFFNDEKITPRKDVLYVPGEENKESIDLVLPPIMFQITIAKKHSKKKKGIKDIKAAFEINEDWKFCWIIPTRLNEIYGKSGDYILNLDYHEEARYQAIMEELCVLEDESCEDVYMETEY